MSKYNYEPEGPNSSEWHEFVNNNLEISNPLVICELDVNYVST